MLNTASKTLNQRLKEFRKQEGLSQREMGKLIGVNQATYSAMERGKSAILHTYLPKFAEIFKVQIWEFFSTPQEIGLLEGEDKEVFEMWKRLTRGDKYLVKQMVRALMDRINLEAARQHDLMGSETISSLNDLNEAN